MLDLYKNIKEKRKALHMTQTELAFKTGYTNKSSIASIESGKIDLPQSKIIEFAKALGCTPGELMGWNDLPEEKEKIVMKATMDAQLLKSIQSLTPENKEKLSDYINYLLSTQK